MVFKFILCNFSISWRRIMIRGLIFLIPILSWRLSWKIKILITIVSSLRIKHSIKDGQYNYDA
jgi:hypothetical protein